MASPDGLGAQQAIIAARIMADLSALPPNEAQSIAQQLHALDADLAVPYAATDDLANARALYAKAFAIRERLIATEPQTQQARALLTNPANDPR